MVEICCVGHITLDKIVTSKSEVHMPGGTSFYFSNAIANMDISYCLVTALGPEENAIVENLRAKGITVQVLPSAHTVYFENIYDENQDKRTQKVLQKADAFSIKEMLDVDAKIFHLGPLLADDIPVELIKYLSEKGTVSLDAQGYLREVRDTEVFATDWAHKKEALQYIDILKVNDAELFAITGCKDLRDGARALVAMGVKEVIVTLGSKGSFIYAEEEFYEVPAYKPNATIDATGCGDTYMAGYLYKKAKNAGYIEAGKFGAAMATLKIESSGPFTGTYAEVIKITGE
ncbi:PfkB family carbohydrate kinase [Arcticibacter eurypsychrophilus]|uniref:PfkB family carbohydrate kinase n=1 Tax=Arcticibacter eurypsychrophilus TaxID=1434752 RepID=UPI00084D1E83|nr:PfkB family carbohydrate kinase [Arcticibacter eurypsychrophilus]